MPAQYYNKVLYPLQNEVFPAFEVSPFYLTGGTALSRGYYNHRYSDDLDYFVNDHSDFLRISERQIERVGAIFTDMKIALRDINFCRIFVVRDFAHGDERPGCYLKKESRKRFYPLYEEWAKSIRPKLVNG